MISQNLKEILNDYYRENVNNFNYKLFSELAVIYATKLDETYKDLFFNQFKEKLIKDMKFLD